MKKIETNEVKRILEMHSKLKKKPILEQNVPDADNDVSPTVSGVNSISNSAPKVELPKINQDEVDLKLLRDAENAECLFNGKLQYLKGTKKPVYVVTVTSEKLVKVVVFYPNMTYKFTEKDKNGKTLSSKSGKWKCDELTTLANTEVQQKAQKDKETQLTTDAKNKKDAYILKFTGTPYNYLFNIPDIEKQKYTELDPVNDLRVPAGVFAVTDKFYSNPSLNKDIKGSSDSVLDDVLTNQSTNRNACRKNIEDYYKAWKRRNSVEIDGPKLKKAKLIVQSCKDEHYSKWGILGSGKKYDEILDIMSGGSGGPLSYGETVIWLLK